MSDFRIVPLPCYVMQGDNPIPAAAIQKFAETGSELCRNLYLLCKHLTVNYDFKVLRNPCSEIGITDDVTWPEDCLPRGYFWRIHLFRDRCTSGTCYSRPIFCINANIHPRAFQTHISHHKQLKNWFPTSLLQPHLQPPTIPWPPFWNHSLSPLTLSIFSLAKSGRRL